MTKPALTSLQIKNLTKPGTYAVGKPRGLSLRVRPSTADGASNGQIVKQWVLRYMLDGKARSLGLGGYPDISLEQARKQAHEIRATKIKLQGCDPLAEKAAAKEEERQLRAWALQRRTFSQCAGEYIRTHRSGWHNAKHAMQWESTIEQYANPHIGDVPVDEINKAHVLSVLRPIWETKNETAGRLRGRIESILDWAKAQELRQGDNPAALKGGLKELLPAISRKRRIVHHSALPYNEIGSFMERLKVQSGIAALALQYLILTACRTNEVIGAKWEEIDLSAGQWIIPAERMKARREHRVPLSKQAIWLLQSVGTSEGYVFASSRNTPLSNMAMLAVLKRMGRSDITVHGFRSTFRDWAGETTSHPREVIEHALAHGLKDETEAAYARGTLMRKRAVLMQDWAQRCNHETSAVVLQMAATR
jgi:integrase